MALRKVENGMTEAEFRRIFDTIPEEFDRYRPHYCPELFADLIETVGITPKSSVLELGPGTGQATEPILKTGCDYHAIELGEHLAEKLRSKFGGYPGFHVVNDDFITHDFGAQRFDVIYSATTIQWIPEDVAFSKTFRLLKPGGTLAMLLTSGDYRTPNEALYARIQAVYQAHFRPVIPYAHGGFAYTNAPAYGYSAVERREYAGTREYTAEEYAAYCGTHSDHLVIPEPARTRLFEGLRNAVLEFGDRLVFNDTHILYLAKKPEE